MTIRRLPLFAAIATFAIGLVLLASPFLRSQESAAGGSQGDKAAAAAKAPQPADRGAAAVAADLQAAVKPGKRWALLVGINKYEHANKLQYCGRDVDILRKALVEHGGYLPEHVHVLSDAAEGSPSPTRGNILIEFTTFLKQAKPEDTVLFAFCGHGKLSEEGDNKGKSYLVPIDGNEELLEDTAIPVERLHYFLDACPARQKIVIFDACHAAGKRGSGEGFDPKDAKPGKGMIELLSCNARQTSQEDDNFQQGVFSYFLAQAIQGAADIRPDGNEDGQISVEEAYGFVQDRVNRHSNGRQSPVFRRGEVEGRLTLAVRATKPSGTTLPDDLLVRRLDEIKTRGRLPAALATSASRWLSADSKTGIGRDLRLALSLLARDQISTDDFRLLIRTAVPQLESHLAARQNWQQRTIRVLLIGVGQFSKLPERESLQAPANDLKLLGDTLRGQCGENLRELVVLKDEGATEPAVRRELERLAGASEEGDVLLVVFTGHGMTGPQEKDASTTDRQAKPKYTQSGLWILHNASANQDKKNFADYLSDTNDDIFPVGDVAAIALATPADVLIFSDTACNLEEWPSLLPEQGDLKDYASFRRSPNGGTKLWIGARLTSERPFGRTEAKGIYHGTLSFRLAQLLNGRADSETPCHFAVPRPPRSTRPSTAPANDQSTNAFPTIAWVSEAEVLALIKKGGTKLGELGEQIGMDLGPNRQQAIERVEAQKQKFFAIAPYGSLRPGDGNWSPRDGQPDGFVSLYELALHFLRKNPQFAKWEEEAGSVYDFSIRGQLGAFDNIFTRSSLPVE